MTPDFLQLHTLTGYSAVLLNRDDIGRAKRLPFGGHDRIRVSSQCLKRHWREPAGQWALAELDTGKAVRSRRIFSDRVAPALVKRGLPAPRVLEVLKALRAHVLGESDKARAGARDADRETADESDGFSELRTEQVIVLGEPEIECLADIAAELARDDSDKTPKQAVEAYFKDRKKKDNLKALVRGAGIDAALFGRMVTSDILARCDAAVHVAHSFTVHAEEAEPDYFSAVDDLVREEGELGSGHINTAELTSGLFYGYAAIDLRQLAKNLSRDPELAAKATGRLVRAIASVSPGAKLGATAPYACAELIIAEAGERQPRTLANAFMDPVCKKGAKTAAVRAIGGYLKRFDNMYGEHEERRFASMIEETPAHAGEPVSLAKLASWAAEKAREAAQ